jgi:hypothetical protein
MRAYDTSYFCEKGHPPLVSIDSLYGYERPEITVYINETGNSYEKPSVTLHIKGEQDLINFKNSVIEAYEAYERGKRGGRKSYEPGPG